MQRKSSIKWSLIICVFLILISAMVAYAADKELTVTSTHRISHPAYDMVNTGQSLRNPFNVDNSRVLLSEYSGKPHPLFPTQRTSGRGRIWGCIKSSCVSETASTSEADSITSTLQDLDLDNLDGLSSAARAKSLTDWDTNTIKIPDAFDFSMTWSPYPGETNIIYALCESTTGSICDGHQYELVAYNVDTGSIDYITSYNDGSNPSKAAIIGFTKDAVTGSQNHQHEIIVDLDFSKKTSGDTYRIFTDHDNSFATPVRYREEQSQSCSWDMTWYPFPQGIHWSVMPDGLWHMDQYGLVKNDGNGGPCSNSVTHEIYAKSYWREPDEFIDWYGFTHYHAISLNDSFVVGNNVRAFPSYKSPSAPAIGKELIYQGIVDKTYAQTLPVGSKCDFTTSSSETACFKLVELINRKSAMSWRTTDNQVVNYHNMPSPSTSSDGTVMFFHGTNNKYTREDNNKRPGITGNNWEGRGSYIAKLSTSGVSANSSDSDVQACSSFTYSAWGECKSDNTQTRTVKSSSPAGCTIDNPNLVQECSYGSNDENKIIQIKDLPIVDGNLSEFTSNNILSLFPTSGGNSVTVKMHWNSDALYLGFSVSDTKLNSSVTSRDGSVWNDDAIEWFIDTNNDGGASSDPNAPFMLLDDYHGIINLLNTQYDSRGNADGNPSGSWNGSWQSAVKLNGTINDNTDNDTGYTVEVKIPWTSIGYSSAPSDDSIIGLSVAIDDKDESEFTSVMMSGITSAYENASNWQQFSLSELTVTADTVPPAPPFGLIIE